MPMSMIMITITTSIIIIIMIIITCRQHQGSPSPYPPPRQVSDQERFPPFLDHLLISHFEFPTTIIIMVIIFFILVISSIVVIFDYLVTSSALSRILIRQNSMKFPFLICLFCWMFIFFIFCSVAFTYFLRFLLLCNVWPEYDWVWGAAYSTEPSDRVQRCWVHLGK